MTIQKAEAIVNGVRRRKQQRRERQRAEHDAMYAENHHNSGGKKQLVQNRRQIATRSVSTQTGDETESRPRFVDASTQTCVSHIIYVDDAASKRARSESPEITESVVKAKCKKTNEGTEISDKIESVTAVEKTDSETQENSCDNRRSKKPETQAKTVEETDSQADSETQENSSDKRSRPKSPTQESDEIAEKKQRTIDEVVVMQ